MFIAHHQNKRWSLFILTSSTPCTFPDDSFSIVSENSLSLAACCHIGHIHVLDPVSLCLQLLREHPSTAQLPHLSLLSAQMFYQLFEL
mmetsp:Transcript_10110/g.37644  ORF Transcript_10110/g.37644 Transcript_10110/m.37644 type:complete len:88 (+) Transcript_10110:192-455(+)